MCGHEELCLGCGKEVTDFSTGDFLRCPRAYESFDAIVALMPKFSTEERCKQVIAILNEGGCATNSWHGNTNTKEWSPMISVVKELAERLMKYETVNGAMFHGCRSIVCKKCAEKQKLCVSCGHEHPPVCPICKTKLVPIR